jgi:hypothetical protein
MGGSDSVGSSGGVVYTNVYVTVYGYNDNDDGSGNYGTPVISNPQIHRIATEDLGTYARPSTVAVDQHFRIASPGDIIYIPAYQKYYIVEDTCVECTADTTAGRNHIDIFIGGNNKPQNANALLQCEYALTLESATIIVDPPNNLPVDAVTLFDPNTNQCHIGPNVSSGDMSSVLALSSVMLTPLTRHRHTPL